MYQQQDDIQNATTQFQDLVNQLTINSSNLNYEESKQIYSYLKLLCKNKVNLQVDLIEDMAPVFQCTICENEFVEYKLLIQLYNNQENQQIIEYFCEQCILNTLKQKIEKFSIRDQKKLREIKQYDILNNIIFDQLIIPKQQIILQFQSAKDFYQKYSKEQHYTCKNCKMLTCMKIPYLPQRMKCMEKDCQKEYCTICFQEHKESEDCNKSYEKIVQEVLIQIKMELKQYGQFQDTFIRICIECNTVLAKSNSSECDQLKCPNCFQLYCFDCLADQNQIKKHSNIYHRSDCTHLKDNQESIQNLYKLEKRQVCRKEQCQDDRTSCIVMGHNCIECLRFEYKQKHNKVRLSIVKEINHVNFHNKVMKS
ncbi:hypothetical protein PPERSA_09237 [Pseudocohnilembus persalinus]|uniref:Uncharacterized protein n=1 Tax=Pseudocohnilembus persalinus TaxID=266149 RepID=A0A0V0QLK0_PSEPJ|nr:hypothetical protein PPERSA_09237 [Pseudocohnilembus persalinus]|eukprot:KRX03225.1 hypothetical protein PPERSA_09237 [Pseudocohnilembus persalinus]